MLQPWRLQGVWGQKFRQVGKVWWSGGLTRPMEFTSDINFSLYQNRKVLWKREKNVFFLYSLVSLSMRKMYILFKYRCMLVQIIQMSEWKLQLRVSRFKFWCTANCWHKYLFESLENFVRHVVLDHDWRDEDFIKVHIVYPQGLVDWFIFAQHLPAIQKIPLGCNEIKNVHKLLLYRFFYFTKNSAHN